MEVALEGWAVVRWEQVEKGLHPGCGGLLRLLLLYSFPDGSWEGWPRGWEGGETGREGRELRVKRL